MIRVEFVSDDGAAKEWHCVVTFWDGTLLIKHEVSVKDKKVLSLSLTDTNQCMK